ncbi:MAG: trigger factor [Gammaproteobacteria bacterium]|nr:trigger factor [Gammaproteobacteria bacterium]
MQVSVETTGSLTRKMTIAVASAEFEAQIANRLKSTAAKVSLPGFRRGKVPLREVERRFGATVRNEVASEVVQSSLEDAVRQEEIPMVGTPSVEVVNVDAGADLTFTATFEVLPDIDLVDLTTLKVRKPVAEIGESDIDDMVESLRKQRTVWNAVERPAAVEDRVVVDYSIKVDGEIQGEPNTDFTFVVGGSQAPAELDAAVVGMSTGESRAFPFAIQRDSTEASHNAEGIGEVALKSVEAPSLPALDETFFEAFGVTDEAPPSDDAIADDRASSDDGATGDSAAPSIGSAPTDNLGDDTGEPSAGDQEGPTAAMQRFRVNVRERMNAELEAATRNETRRQVMVSLASAHGFELPRVLVEQELEQERQRMAQLIGMPVQLADLGEPIRQRAEDRVRTRLVVREIVQREGLVAEDARIRARIDEIAAAYEQPDDVRNWIFGDEDQLQRVELGVLEDQLVDHVLSHADVEPVPASYKDVVTGHSIPEPAVQAPLAGPAVSKPTSETQEGDEIGTGEGAGDQSKGTARGRLRRWLTGR